LLLVEYLLQKMRTKWQGKSLNVLELGSGIGLVGSMIAQFPGIRKVVLTDGNPSVVKILKNNITLNSPKASLSSALLEWGNKIHINKVIKEIKGFDVIVASNTLYQPSSVIPFFTTAATCLKAKGVMIVSRSLRNETMETEIKKASKMNGFVLTSIVSEIGIKKIMSDKLCTIEKVRSENKRSKIESPKGEGISPTKNATTALQVSNLRSASKDHTSGTTGYTIEVYTIENSSDKS